MENKRDLGRSYLEIALVFLIGSLPMIAGNLDWKRVEPKTKDNSNSKNSKAAI